VADSVGGVCGGENADIGRKKSGLVDTKLMTWGELVRWGRRIGIRGLEHGGANAGIKKVLGVESQGRGKTGAKGQRGRFYGPKHQRRLTVWRRWQELNGIETDSGVGGGSIPHHHLAPILALAEHHTTGWIVQTRNRIFHIEDPATLLPTLLADGFSAIRCGEGSVMGEDEKKPRLERRG